MAKIFKEHQHLLIRRESRVVVGKKAVNLWLLVLVLLATFLSIAFSAGSMAYLNDKMNDPFTNWVNINRDASLEKISKLKYELEKESILHHFLFDGVQTEINASLDMLSPNGRSPLFSILYYEDMSSDLIAAVLSEENVVHGVSIAPDSISERSLGIIMTQDALEHLGFDYRHAPAFVDCQRYAEGADSLGFETTDGFVRAPLPLLAVVKRLPMNMEIVASKYLYGQLTMDVSDDQKPFNMNNEHYARVLRFFVPDEVTNFDEGALQNIPDSLRVSSIVQTSEESIQERLRTWKKGNIKTVYVGYPSTPIAVINAIERDIVNRYKEHGVQRVYDYVEGNTEIYTEQRESTSDDVLSVHFVRLDSIRAFERYVKEVSELQIEMSQVNSKENFNAVSVMATILSAAMIVFSIICIIIFIANMLQNYFQKVKRNMGTFKAFGISTRELMGVYIVIIIGIVLAALAIALAVTWLMQLFLPLLGVMKDGEYSYFLLWNARTWWAIGIIIVATTLTVLFVMHRLLHLTPGDLIYER